MEKLIEFIKSAIIFPYAVFWIMIGIFKALFLGQSEPSGKLRKFNFWEYTLSAFIYISILGYSYYNSQFYGVTYVYACPDNGNSKCYKVTADMEAGECEDVEYTNRGATGGGCADDTITAINFPNTGHISFEYCDMTLKDKWTCHAEDPKDGDWNIQIAEIVKVRKQR